MNVNGMDFKELLKEKGCKLTTQRRAVLDVLNEHSGEHLSTEEIYGYVKEKCPEIGLATVYRTVQLFEEIKIIDKLNFDDGCSRYELSSNEEDHHHHHLICEVCNKVMEVEEDLLEGLEEQIENKYNFKITNHKVKFYGICSKCMES
ncbi:Fur family transcriptional regulator [Defluviitalea phaphyphila]|uniref:Fur family transcriptional regulator n=1 Tax=Defluviitalea phaphyphila TaxID=1473580 RepID=UPI00072FF669|nr:Fur family transcriptional regulator [Defluviitalea phaphyphila]